MYSEPWFRGFDGWWYSYVRQGGKRRQVKLVKGEDQREAAYDRWHELCRKPLNQTAPKKARWLRPCAYHLRHTFASFALQHLDPVTVGTLMGHTDGGATLG